MMSCSRDCRSSWTARRSNRNVTARGVLACVANPEVLAIDLDACIAGARLLRAGANPVPPRGRDDITFQVFGRPVGAGGRWAAVLVNRSPAPLNAMLDWDELGLPDLAGAARVRDAGARTDAGT